MTNNRLADVSYGKVIPRGYGNIKHLAGSRMKDSGDSLLDAALKPYFTERLQFPKRDIIFITEKVDGANVAVLKNDGKLYPVMRKGYDVRTSEYLFLRRFADFVSDNAARFYGLLNDGERVCGEWMIKTHSLFYVLPHEPFIVFDIISSDGKQIRPSYSDVLARCARHGFTSVGVVWEGSALAVNEALNLLGKGFHGCRSAPEGVVYRYERDGSFEMSAKYVANLSVGGDFLSDDDAYNQWENWNG